MISLFLPTFWLSFSSLSAQRDACRILEFKSAMKGYHLEGHVFKSVDVHKETDCDVKCYLESDCVSFNVVSSPQDGTITCELSNSDHQQHPEALKRHFGAIYQPIKNACLKNLCPPDSTCQNGYTDKGYRCKKNTLTAPVNAFPVTTQTPQTTQKSQDTNSMQFTQLLQSVQVTSTTETPGITQTLVTNRATESTETSGSTQGPGTIRASESAQVAARTTQAIQATSHTTLVQQTTPLPETQLALYFGQNKTIFCPIQSYKESNITWLYQGNEALPDGVVGDGTKGLKITFVKMSHEGMFTCVVRNVNNSFRSVANIAIRVSYPETCSRIKANISDVSSWYIIDPDGTKGVASFPAYCNMTDKEGAGVTVIGHDTENRTQVDSCDPKGCYKRDVAYTDVTIPQLAVLADVSAYCEQFISYECKKAKLVHDGTAWWESHDGRKMEYWGGTTKKHHCSCGLTQSCADEKEKCNCDGKENSWREDRGFLTDKSSLPVSQLRFGDTKKDGVEGYHTLGKLKCYGIVASHHREPSDS